MEQISITEKEGDNYAMLIVKGSVNSYTFTEFQTKVYELVAKTNLCLDLSEVTNLSSAGMGVLMTAVEDAQASGHRLFLLKPSEIVKMAVDSTGFPEMFTIIRSSHEIQ
jgi:anti-sigma B factor antagonist